MTFIDRLRENVGIAIDTLRTSKLRSALTILGVVIGVSTVMTMATLVRGIQDQILRTVEIAGPTTFYVMRIFSQTPLNPDALPKYVRVRPELSLHEAQRIATLPEIKYAAMMAIINGRIEYQGQRTIPNRIYAGDEHVTEIIGGELVLGRWFTRGELASGAAVVVLPESYARQLFGRANPLGKVIKVAGRPAEVIGLYGPETNIFQPPGVETEAIIPFLMAWQQIPFDKTQQMMIAVKPRAGVTLDAATEAVTIQLREMRRLHPTDKNSFDIMTQEDLLDRFNKLSGAFFLVMIVLSSVGLLVGGIGVMAIMMVSVTSRTREIGVRKALGASRRDIMLQFLIESCTLTGIGGAIGVATGLLFGRVIGLALAVTAPPPVTPTVVAVLVSVGIGVVFGLIPARRAARLDPVEALRYE